MDTGGVHETFALGTKKCVTHSIVGSMGITMFVSVPLSLNLMGQLLKYYKGEILSLENWNLLKLA